jgi:ATP-dependent RNA helicase DeaD
MKAPESKFERYSMDEFEAVVPALAQALRQRGYDTLTSVQKAVLAPELAEADALVSAQTGSGKTVAFGLALAPTLLAGQERLAPARAPLGLVIAPTRELALQVKQELEWLYAPLGATLASCVGGMDMRGERHALGRGAHIVVGTPGRLCDHIRRHSLDISTLKAVVLDEADEMLDMGFREDLEFILQAAPAERRTLMFSATVPRTIMNLAKQYQRDAVRIAAAGEQKQHLDIEYRALTVDSHEKENAIVNVLRYFEAETALVFCATRATVNHMTARFSNRGFSVVALSGELSQKERTHALQAMRDGRARVCVATDVAARGIDLPGLELVVHADLPTDRETLLHRSGRTGRAGRKGVSVVIVPRHARNRAQRLLQNAGIEAKWERPPSADDVLQRDQERLLADPVLSTPVTDDERSVVETLLARHSAEQVAAAFVRRYRAGQSAPEEIEIIAAPAPRRQEPRPPFEPNRKPLEAKKKQHTAFGASVWFSISVGRKQNAEPRWLLPMLCGAGGLTKRDIGSITIQAEESQFELAADAVERFLEAVGPNQILEKNIRVRRLDAAPQRAPGADTGNGPDAGARKPRPPSAPDTRGRKKPEHRPAASGAKATYQGQGRPKHAKRKPDKDGRPRPKSAEA